MSGKIIYGKKNLLPAKIDPKDVMVTISVRMEGDLLDAIRDRADQAGLPYQTYMKTILRGEVLGEGKQPNREEMAARLAVLESAVFGAAGKSVAQAKRPAVRRSRKKA